MMESQPCPFCRERGGFHDEEIHAQLYAAIDPKLKRPSNTAVRAAERLARGQVELRNSLGRSVVAPWA